MTNAAPAASGGKSLAELRSAGKQVARQAGGGTVAAFFEANKDAIKAVLPQHMTPDRMLKIALRALRTTPKLMDCTIESLFGSVVSCAQLGLEPNTPQGHVYLIPFENRKKQQTEVQVIIGYKGLIDLARRSGEIVSISSRVVYSNDKFSLLLGTDDQIEHVPEILKERGAVVGFYAVAKLKDGGVQFEFMSKREVDDVMKSTQSRGNYGPWKDHYEEMGRKTVIRRLCKYLPMSIELATATALDGRAERGEAQGLSQVLEGADYNVLESVMDSESAPELEDEDDSDAAGQQQIESKPEQAMPMPTVDERQAERVETDTSASTAKGAAQPKAARAATSTASASPPPAEEAMPDLPADDDTDTGSLFSE